MFDIFEGGEDPSVSHYQFPAWLFIRRNMQKEIARITDYYHKRPFYLNSNNILKDLLNNINVPISHDLDRYVDMFIDRAMKLTKSLGFSTPFNNSHVFNGLFYGEGSSELIILNDQYENLSELESNWKEIESFKVLLHPISDFGLTTPDGTKQSTANGFAVIEINLAMLAVQYRSFMRIMERNQQSEDTSNKLLLSVSNFLMMFPMANMLYSHLDLVIYNRFKNLYYGEPMSASLRRLPFTIRDYTSRIDKTLLKIISVLTDRKYPYGVILTMIPTIHSENMFKALQLPDYPPTRQIDWVYAVARLNVYRLIIELGGQQSIDINESQLVTAKRNLRYLQNQNILKTKLNKDDLHDVEDDIKYIESVI